MHLPRYGSLSPMPMGTQEQPSGSGRSKAGPSSSHQALTMEPRTSSGGALSSTVGPLPTCPCALQLHSGEDQHELRSRVSRWSEKPGDCSALLPDSPSQLQCSSLHTPHGPTSPSFWIPWSWMLAWGPLQDPGCLLSVPFPLFWTSTSLWSPETSGASSSSASTRPQEPRSHTALRLRVCRRRSSLLLSIQVVGHVASPVSLDVKDGDMVKSVLLRGQVACPLRLLLRPLEHISPEQLL